MDPRPIDFHRDHDGQVYVIPPVPQRVEIGSPAINVEGIEFLSDTVAKVRSANVEATYVGSYVPRRRAWVGFLLRFAWVQTGLARMVEITTEHEAELQRLEAQR